jgi:hypothetical protein
MLETWWGRSLVASRASRAAYAVLKCVCFCSLGLLLSLAHMPAAWIDAAARHWLAGVGQALVAATVIFCILRAIPVIWEGRRYLAAGEKASSPAAIQVTQ